MVYCVENDETREGKFSIFQIIKFPNDPCQGGTRNGTCFTKQECEDQGGTESGSCADGFGVCCSVVLQLGGSTSLNQSYIVQASSANVQSGQMQYRICPCSSDVCRIRFDFTQFMLAGPFVKQTNAPGAGMPGLNQDAYAQGDCLTDTFSITGPMGGTPIICGTNQGQHMIVDTDGSSCLTVNFGIGAGTTDTRQWDIMTTQYRCGDENGGPPGCLQWHTADTGSFRSFNFPNLARGADVVDEVSHLSNQEYSICIRKPTNSQYICYIPCTYVAGGADAQQSFGISTAPAATANSGVGATKSQCSEDYIEIIGGTTEAIAMIATTVKNTHNNVWCGRNFATADNTDFATGTIIAEFSVCSRSVPFRVRVNFNENEHIKSDNSMEADVDATDGEFNTRPGGIIGFSLCYTTGGT